MADKVLPRNKIDRKFTWNAESVFASDEAWEKEIGQIIQDIEKIKQFQGRLAEGPSILLDALNTASELVARAQIAFLGQQPVKKIIIAMDDRRGKLPIEELLRWKTNGIEIVDGITFYERLTGRLLVERMNPSFIVYSDGFSKSRLTRSIKRLSAVIMAVLGLLLAWPFAGILALAIRLDSRGPVIVRQQRCGQGGRIFELLKFRSMVADAEVDCKPVWAEENDCRVTRVGRILRKYRLDEIPQLWNVVRGYELRGSAA